MNPELRLSDAERDEAVRQLGEHFAAGRLTADEHAERSERVFAATTYGELPPLFVDLPGGAPFASPEPATRWAPPLWGPSRRRPRFGALRLALVALLLLVVVTHLPLIVFGLVVWWAVGGLLWRRTACGGHPRMRRPHPA